MVVWLAAACQPAWAGQYQYVGSTSTTATLTTTNNQGQQSTEELPSPTLPTRQLWGPNVRMQYHWEITYHFEWVPQQGMTLEQDPPVQSGAGLEWTAYHNWLANSGSGWMPGSVQGTWTASTAASSNGFMSSVSTTPDGSGGAIVDADGWGWSTQILGFELTGPNPAVTVHFDGDLTRAGSGAGEMSFLAPPPPTVGGKFIWITYPTSGTRFVVARIGDSVTVTLTGGWTPPEAGVTYRVYVNKAAVPSGLIQANEVEATIAGWTWSRAGFVIPFNGSKHIRIQALLKKQTGPNSWQVTPDQSRGTDVIAVSVNTPP